VVCTAGIEFTAEVPRNLCCLWQFVAFGYISRGSVHHMRIYVERVYSFENTGVFFRARIRSSRQPLFNIEIS
jgi:hypothetical protein